jgi:hypothetical protein
LFFRAGVRRIHASGIGREGERAVPVTKAEDAAILAKHAHAVVYKEPPRIVEE